jgi:hypothetical protein
MRVGVGGRNLWRRRAATGLLCCVHHRSKRFFPGKGDLAISFGHFGARFVISLAGIKADEEGKARSPRGVIRAAIQVIPEGHAKARSALSVAPMRRFSSRIKVILLFGKCRSVGTLPKYRHHESGPHYFRRFSEGRTGDGRKTRHTLSSRIPLPSFPTTKALANADRGSGPTCAASM